MWWFILGLLIGANLSLFLYALIFMSKEADNREYGNESIIE